MPPSTGTPAARPWSPAPPPRPGRDRGRPERGRDRGPVREGLGARRQGPRPGCRGPELQVRGQLLARRAPAQQPDRGLSRLHRAQLFARRPTPLPSARGQGEPLTGRLDPPTGASFVAVLGDPPETRLLLASDAGYGFVVRMEDLYAKPKAGKAVLNLPEGAAVLAARSPSRSPRACVWPRSPVPGYLLVFPLSDLPEMPRGKGNKIVGIPSARVAAREELLAALAVVPPGAAPGHRLGQAHLHPQARGPRPLPGRARAARQAPAPGVPAGGWAQGRVTRRSRSPDLDRTQGA